MSFETHWNIILFNYFLIATVLAIMNIACGAMKMPCMWIKRSLTFFTLYFIKIFYLIFFYYLKIMSLIIWASLINVNIHMAYCISQAYKIRINYII